MYLSIIGHISSTACNYYLLQPGSIYGELTGSSAELRVCNLWDLQAAHKKLPSRMRRLFNTQMIPSKVRISHASARPVPLNRSLMVSVPVSQWEKKKEEMLNWDLYSSCWRALPSVGSGEHVVSVLCSLMFAAFSKQTEFCLTQLIKSDYCMCNVFIISAVQHDYRSVIAAFDKSSLCTWYCWWFRR